MIDDNQALIEALEREILADALEKDLGLIRLACAQMIAPRRLMHTVDRLLTYWGYRYFYEDRREITHETGVKSMLGRLVKRKNAENNVHTPYTFIIDDTRYQRINSAVVKMPTYYREFVARHYIIDETRNRYRNGRTVTEFTRLLDIPRSTYDTELHEAKQLAVANGII